MPSLTSPALGYAFGCLVAIGALACGASPHAASSCVPGATQACVCPSGASGAQRCGALGDRWEECRCSAGVADAGAPADDGTMAPKGDGLASADAVDGAIVPPTSDGALVPKPDAIAHARAPIMIAASNYVRLGGQLAAHGPFIVYAWATNPALGSYSQQLALLGQIKDAGVTKMVVYSSHKTVANKLAGGGAAQLKALGVRWLGYNTEGGMTPSSEMGALGAAVVAFARLAEQSGFDSMWGPVRYRVDATSPSELAAMFTAGLDGVALQEQKFIEASCVAARVNAVKATAARVRAAGGARAMLQVQVMPSRCLAGDAYAAKRCGGAVSKFGHCAAFAQQVGPHVDSVAIWASGPQDISQLVPLISVLRR